MEKKKNIVLVILFIIVGVMACFGIKMSKEIFELKQNNNTNVNENNNQQEQQKKSDTQTSEHSNVEEEKELSDAYIKKDISKKASIMLTMGTSNTEEEIAKYTIPAELKLINLNNNDKLGIILTATEKFRKLQSYEVQEKIPTIFKKYYSNSYSTSEEFVAEYSETNPYIVEGNIITKEYMEMFNSKPINQSNISENLGVCPFYLYDNATDVYMSSSACGGICQDLNYLYKYKYTIKGNNIYVYVAAASTGSCGDEDKKIYNDIGAVDRNFLYNGSSDTQVINDLKSNLQKYAQYKLTFEKNDEGIYYYKTTEKIN